MTTADLKHLRRWGLVFNVFAGLLVILAVFMMARSAWWDTSRPAPFTYSRNVYYPLAPVCPGGTLQWRSEYTFHMRGEFVTVKIARVLFDVQTRRMVSPDRELEYFVWTSEERDRLQVSAQKYVLPADLPVGQYELRVGASASDSEDTGYRVPFVIPLSCKKEQP